MLFIIIGVFAVRASSAPSFVLAQDAESEGANGKKIEETQASIKDLEKKLEKETEKKEGLEQNLNQIQRSIYTTQNEINKTEKLISDAEENIARKEEEIKNLNDRVRLQKELVRKLIQDLYYVKKESIIGVIFSEKSFHQFLGQADHLLNLEQKIFGLVDEMKSSQEKIEQGKNELEKESEDHEKLLQIKEVQQKNLVADKYETQGDIQEKEATIGELQQKMNELRNDLNRILGKSYDTGEIKDAIKFANKVTGVRKGFLFGMLSMESGGNPLAGNCTYNNSSMNISRKKYFREICEELDYNYKKQPVSCASPSYPGTGGAMGAAQFMSDTWIGYKSKIASATGNNRPDPWDLLDGVVAMALKLKNDGATEKGDVRITSPCTGKKVYVNWEVYASMKYLGWSCYALKNYAPGIQSLAKGYDKL